MSTEVAVKTQSTEIVDYKETAIDYLRGMGLSLPQKYANQFVEMAKAFNLNPFKREIYAVGYGDNWDIITGFEVYLKRAEKTGLLDGWKTEESGSVKDGTLKSTITIYRKDRSHEFTHTVYYCEAVNKNRDGNPNAIWKKMPIYMTKKVAMAQGFRLCFPDEVGGMPYTSDEINEPELRDVTPHNEVHIQDQMATVSVITKDNAEKNGYGESSKNKLEKLCTKYASYLQGQPLDMAMAVVNAENPSDADCNSMYTRCCSYLSKKGVQVA